MQSTTQVSEQIASGPSLEYLCEKAIIKIWQMGTDQFSVTCDRIHITSMLANRAYNELL